MVVLALWIGIGHFASAQDPRILSVDGSTRATGYHEANKIITFGDKTHITWLDSVAGTGFDVKIKTLDHLTQEWSPTYTIGTAQDNHGGPALTVDSEGYLHVAYGPHSAPMKYRKSLLPNDASAWSTEALVGDRLTYPTLLTGPDNTIFMMARNRTDSIWTQNFYSLSPGGTWSQPTVLVLGSEPDYFHFENAVAWGPDHQTLHMTLRMYGETPNWGYKLGYMKSSDFGQTWQTYDGTPISLPAVDATLDTIIEIDPSQRGPYENSSSLRGGAIAVDANNVPHLLYNTLEADGTRPRQAWIATPNETGGWNSVLLNDKIDILPSGWGLGLPGGLTITDDGRMTMVLTMANDTAQGNLWGTTSSEVLWVESADGGQTFTSRVISEIDPNIPHWLPNLEKQTGFNELMTNNPAVVYTAGQRGSNNNEIVSTEVVLWAEGSNIGWNGILGDVNQNGIFSGDGTGPVATDDFSAFLAYWNKRDLPGIFGTRESYMNGDLNLDGKVDLKDAFLMRKYLIENPFPPERLESLQKIVPEPGSAALVSMAIAFCLATRMSQQVPVINLRTLELCRAFISFDY
jgi:hypothetical protein